MWNTVVGEQIRRANRNLLVCNLIILLIACWFFSLGFNGLYNDLLGPQEMSAEEVAAVTAPEKLPRNYVKFKGGKVTGLSYMAESVRTNKKSGQEVSRRMEAVFQLVTLPKKLLVVQSVQPLRNADLVGVLLPLPEDIGRVFRGHLAATSRELPDYLSPVMLEARTFRYDALLLFLFLAPPLVLFAFNFKKYLARSGDMLKHPSCARLSRYGDPREVINQIEREMQADKSGNAAHDVGVIKIGAAVMTESWLLQRGLWGLDVRRLDDLIWAYPHQSVQTFYLIPISKSHSIYSCFPKKKTLVAAGPKADCDRFYEVLQKRVPWALFGYSEALSRAWGATPQILIDQVKVAKTAAKMTPPGPHSSVD